MRTVAASRQIPRPDLATAPQGFTWLVYCRENKLLTASEWALAAILVTLGQGQNITLSVTGMADITGMTRKTVANAINGLVAKGLMTVKGKGQHNRTFYRLTLPKTPATESMATRHCINGDQSLSKSGPVTESMATTTSREQKEVDEQLHQHTDDAVAEAPSGENRGKGSTRSKGSARSGSTARATTRAEDESLDDEGFASVEEYVLDLEGCAGDLEVRLFGVDDGQVDVKPLAKMLRNLGVRYRITCMWSDILSVYPVGHKIWWQAGRKDVPVGYLMRLIELEMIKQNKEEEAQDGDLEARFLELFTGREYLPGHRISELMPDVDFEVSIALIKRLLAEGRIVKISSPPNSYKLADDQERRAS